MIWRAAHWLLRFVGAIVTGLAVIVAFGAWLLSRGPLSLDAVAPYVASMLGEGNGLSASIDHTFLSIADGRFAVLARGVHLRRDAGGASLTLSDLVLEFSPRAALKGVIAPTRIVAIRPELRLERSADGSFHMGIGDLATDSAEDWGQKIIGDLAGPAKGEGVLGSLTEVSVQGASLTVDDRSLGLQWQAAADALLRRSGDHSAGSFRLVMGQGTGGATVNGDFTVLLPSDQFVVRVAFKDLRPAGWADAAPSLAPLAALDLPISGEFRAELDPHQLTLRDAIADLTFGPGALRQALMPNGALPVASGVLQAGYDAIQGRVNLGLLALDLGAGTISASGTVDGVASDILSGGKLGAVDIALNLAAHGVKVDDFPRLWPERAASDTRVWVTQHLHDGTVDDVAAHFLLHADLADTTGHPAKLQELDGTMKFEGLSVEYFRPLPLVRNVAGTAHFDATSIDFAATGGDLGAIRATAATARFYKLDTHDEQAQITVSAQGPLADVLAVLDMPPLGYAHDIGLDPKRAAGSFVTKIALDFPLLRDLPVKDVDYSADATLSDVALGGAMAERDLTNGALTLKLDRQGAQVDGSAALSGVPLTLSWRQSFDAKAPVRTHYDVTAQLDAAQRKALGLDFLADIVSGPVAVAASYDLAPSGRGRAVGTVDLKDAALEVKKLNWKKAAGTPAMARFTADLADDKVTAIRDAIVKGQGVDAKASITLSDGSVSNVAIDYVIAGDNDFHGTVERLGTDGWRIAASGKSLDASGLADELSQAQPSTGTEPPLALDLTLDRLILGPQRDLRALTASLASDGTHWQSAHLDAKLSDKAGLKLDYDGAADGRPFKLTSDDFGALLRLLNIYDDIQGGSFDLTGHAEDRVGHRTLIGSAQGGNYRVVQAPTLARLLSLASFSGMNALLTGQGIPFDRLEGEIDFTEGKITLNNARTYGGAIGINASGEINRAAGQMNVSGTLVPAYTLNSVIGDIPLLGNLLVGGEGQGVFASNFRVFGPIEKPEVSVNALSTLAPGFLRNLFLFSPRGP